MRQIPTCCILILLDGLGDRSFAELGHRTPLQAANTPNLDKLAAKGANGIMHCGDQGKALPSENAHFALFGYQPHEFPGRGFLEALGAGIQITGKETAFLAHLSMLKQKDNTLLLVKDRPKLKSNEVSSLFAAIEKFSYSNMHCRLIQTKGVDAILVFSKPSSPHVTDTLPFFNNMPLVEPQPLLQFQNDPIAVETAAALKAYLVWCHQVLSSHPFNLRRKEEGTNPLNGLVTLRPGQKKAIENFNVRWGLKGLSISSGLLYRGLSNFLGIDFNEAEDSDDPGRDIYDRLMQAEAAKNNYDFIHVHTKTPDEAAHTKNCHKKVETIEALDRGIGKAMASLLSSDTQLVITSDHSTPSSGPLIHSGEPVPITMVGPGIRRDSINRYSEVDCAGGALGYIQGSNLMFMVLNSLDRIKLEGLHDTPVDQYFWPGQRKPFLLL